MDADRTAQTTDLLQTMIRNACVNDGSVESGQEIRNASTLLDFLEGAGLEMETYDAAPGRRTLVAKLEGTDPDAPSLCFDGHTDVVPVNEAGWSRDPFGGELVEGEVWGRGAVDMLNLTASMAVAMRHLGTSGFRPVGDLIFLAVADEESGSTYGARWMGEHQPDVMSTTYVLTENGGIHGGSEAAPLVQMSVGEKGVAWRRLVIRGTPGHGSMPFKADSALVKAAAVVTALADYRPAPGMHDLWPGTLELLGLDDDTRRQLLDPGALEEFLDALPKEFGAPFLHACTHTTFSANTSTSQTKTNIIPDKVVIDVDIRTLPGEGHEEVDQHIREALGDLYDVCEVEVLMNDRASISPMDTPLWDTIQRAVARPFPATKLSPNLLVGFTDARVHRDFGGIAYGAGLLDPSLSPAEFGSRFHGNDERIDVESLALTTQFWIDVATDLLG